MMTGVPDVVRCLFMPLGQNGVLLPIAAVAEIIAYVEPEPILGGAPSCARAGSSPPDLVLGTLAWRERTLPVCSLEAAIGQPFDPPGTRGRTVILHGLGAQRPLPFLAIAIQGLPTMVPASSASVHWIADERSAEIPEDGPATGAGKASTCIMGWVEANGRDAWIPDLEIIEGWVADRFDEVAGPSLPS